MAVLAAVAVLSAAPVGGAKGVIHVPGWPKIPIFSPATVVGDLIFVSGMVGFDFNASPPAKCAGGIAGETACALRNVETVMRAAGSTLANVADCTVFLADIDDFQAMNAVYTKFFPRDPPARAAFAVASLAGDALVEIKCSGSVGQ
ncbi:hypothetical protein KFE25_010291 [Diacronema lutheri]|uniref:Uncharacterized protein n=2 Tax=Diacronema lutheri TaxID=2081491 RepID=A0A8J5XBK9_DIALT|nr:hypothetical protein KFE25_010291 [Diacronema lutheri]